MSPVVAAEVAEAAAVASVEEEPWGMGEKPSKEEARNENWSSEAAGFPHSRLVEVQGFGSILDSVVEVVPLVQVELRKALKESATCSGTDS